MKDRQNISVGIPVARDMLKRGVDYLRPRKLIVLPLVIIVLLSWMWLRLPPQGLTATYYPNPEWRGAPVFTHIDREINLVDFERLVAAGQLPSKQSSIAWNGWIKIEPSGEYRFYTESDDGSSIIIDNQLVVDNGGFHRKRRQTKELWLTAGMHLITISYFNVNGNASLKVWWKDLSSTQVPIPDTMLFTMPFSKTQAILSTYWMMFALLYTVSWGWLLWLLCPCNLKKQVRIFLIKPIRFVQWRIASYDRRHLWYGVTIAGGLLVGVIGMSLPQYIGAWVLLIEMKTSISSVVYVYFDTGKGFYYQSESTSFIATNMPLCQTYTMPLPAKQLANIRIVPTNPVGRFEIRSITVRNRLYHKKYIWRGMQLFEALTPLNDAIAVEQQQDAVVGWSQGNDASLKMNLAPALQFRWAERLYGALCLILMYSGGVGMLLLADKFNRTWTVKRMIRAIRPERFFLVTALFFGLLFVILTPPFLLPDEPAHFFRAYATSQFKITDDIMQQAPHTPVAFTPSNPDVAHKIQGKEGWYYFGNYIPVSFLRTLRQSEVDRLVFHPEQKTSLKTISDLFKIPLNPEVEVFSSIMAVSSSPMCYFPQVIGIWLGRLFSASPILLLYLGRVSSLLFWCILGYWTIRRTPIFKWVFAILMLTPMTLFLAGGISADVVTNALAFFLTATLLRLAFDPQQRIPNQALGLLAGLACAIALTKVVYIALLLLYFLLIPRRKVGRLIKYVMVGLLLLCIGVGSNYVWSNMKGVTLTDRTHIRIGTNAMIETANATRFILAHPGAYLSICLNTIAAKSVMFIESMIGVLGWADTELPHPLILAYIVLLIWASLLDNNLDIIITWKQKSVSVFSLFFQSLL